VLGRTFYTKCRIYRKSIQALPLNDPLRSLSPIIFGFGFGLEVEMKVLGIWPAGLPNIEAFTRQAY
jgi:hypothetical protein